MSARIAGCPPIRLFDQSYTTAPRAVLPHTRRRPRPARPPGTIPPMAGPRHQSGRTSHLAILPLALLAALGSGGCAGGGSGGNDGGFFGLFAPPQPDPNDVTTPMTQYERARLLSR